MPTKAVDSTSHNYDFWQTEKRARKFKVMHGLQPPERSIIDWLATQYEKPAILDLGVGAGRTTEALSQISGDYTGLDYSQIMVDICKERYPKAKFVVGDACTLEGFDDNSFEIVVFSYNGIDCVSDEARADVYSSVKRVLKPSGIFVHSSHNFSAEDLHRIRDPYSLSRIEISLNPISFFRSIYLYGVGIASHSKLKSSQKFGEGWAVLNEQTNRFRELMYYVTPQRQSLELEQAGFEVSAMYGRDGKIIASPELAKDSWVYYVSKKVGS